MKKLMVIAAAMFAACTLSFAQSKGDMLVGGSFGFSASNTSYKNVIGNNTTSTKSTLSGLHPGVNFAYFLSNHFYVGAHLDSDFSFAKNSNSHSVNIGPSVGYVHQIASNLFYICSLSVSGDFESNDFSGIKIGLTPASFEYMLNSEWGITASLFSFSFKSLRDPEKEVAGVKMHNSRTYFGTSFNAPRLGVNFHF